TDECGGALQAFDRHVALGFEDAINLGAAGMHAFGELGFGDALPPHFFFQLPRDHARQRLSLRGFPNAFFSKKAIDGCSPMGILLRHLRISCIRRRARSRSFAGVFCVFLMNPCTTPMRLSWTKNSNRAMRRLGKRLRTSHKPSPNGRHKGMPIGQPNWMV